MRKTQYNPVVISNVYPLGKGEVACSNHASSTIPRNKYRNVFNEFLYGFFAAMLCIIALAILICSFYAIHYCIITYMLAH